jgi:hypothetical protein
MNTCKKIVKRELSAAESISRSILGREINNICEALKHFQQKKSSFLVAHLLPEQLKLMQAAVELVGGALKLPSYISKHFPMFFFSCYYYYTSC